MSLIAARFGLPAVPAERNGRVMVTDSLSVHRSGVTPGLSLVSEPRSDVVFAEEIHGEPGDERPVRALDHPMRLLPVKPNVLPRMVLRIMSSMPCRRCSA